MTSSPAPRLKVGDTAPSFTLPNDSGSTTSLEQLLAEGKKVLVYFYPRANTPGCTTEACDFRDSMAVLNSFEDEKASNGSNGIAVVGISPDKVDKLAKFRDDHDLNFPLLSDEDKAVMTAWGAFGEKKNYGKIVQGVIRSTFLVDTDQTIALALYNVKATGHVARVLRELGC